MPTDAEITFADHAGRLYARRYGMAPMVGRLLGYLAICDPREQSIGELAEALLASRSAIANAVNSLETLGLIRRSRAAWWHGCQIWRRTGRPTARRCAPPVNSPTPNSTAESEEPVTTNTSALAISA